MATTVSENQTKRYAKRQTEKANREKTARYEKLMREAKNALDDYRRCCGNFNFISDAKLVDVSIYNIQTAQSRLEYLLCEIRSFEK